MRTPQFLLATHPANMQWLSILPLLSTLALAAAEDFPTFNSFPVQAVSQEARPKRQYTPAPPAPYSPAPYSPPVYHEPAPYTPPVPAYHEPAPYHAPEPAYAPAPYHPEPYHEPHHNEHGVPGYACKDYPCLAEAPYTKFTCASAPFSPGMYADPESGCQVRRKLMRNLISQIGFFSRKKRRLFC